MMMRIATTLAIVAACDDAPVAKDATQVDAAVVDVQPDAFAFPPCANPVQGTTITFRDLGAVQGGALLVTAPLGDLRLFVLEQGGAIRIFDNDVLLPEPFIDLSDNTGGPVLGGGEQGLLGLAFHPNYAANGTFFVFYTRRQLGDTVNSLRDVVARCQRSATDPNKADPTCVEILAIPDFASNHNGGMIEFGRDGFLYVGTGDGGSANDPNRNSQALVDGSPMPNTQALLGKILRIDVDLKDPGKEYKIPDDNPFAAGGGAPEIFQLGLRNPWRWSFDSLTGDMWIGDVGQGSREEIHVVRAADLKGKNFGWSDWEGNLCRTPTNPTCNRTNYVFPQDERTHNAPPAGDGWAAIIGGQVYRGTCYPDIVGTYFYTDNLAAGLATATLNSDGTLTVADLTPPPGMQYPRTPASIHSDGRGELYLTTSAVAGGHVFHLEAGP